MTPLDKSLKRTLTLDGREYVITLTPDVLKITQKGHRLGIELKWQDLVSGESALAVALHASIGKFQDAPRTVAAPRKAAARPRASAKPSAARGRVPSVSRAAANRPRAGRHRISN
jgi:hypothetical protein